MERISPLHSCLFRCAIARRDRVRIAPGVAESIVAIVLTVLAYNFIGDGLRDALDPRMNI